MNIPAGHLAGNRSEASPLDNYSTPRYATEALILRENFEGAIWESACGEGRMSLVLEEYFPGRVLATDIINGVDFLKETRITDNIITNPPYKYAQQFVEQSLKLADKKVAMFLRLNFLESQGRYRLFKSSPLKTIYVFCKRQALSPPNVIVTSGGTIAYAWYVWDKSYKGSPLVDWIND